MLTFFIIYLLCGAGIGFLAGLFGIGGGILVIPVLLTLFSLQHMPEPVAMHMAIGTSLATIIIASASSVFAYYRKGDILFPLVKQCAPGSIIGSMLGVFIANHIHSIYLERVFSVILLFVAFHLFFRTEPLDTSTLPTPNGKMLFFAAIVFGILGGMLGIGGGIFIIPFFQWCGFSIRHSIATAAACILPVAIVGTLGYMIFGTQLNGLPPFSTGYIYWPAFLGISLTSVFTARLGVRVSHTISTTLLKKLFALFLIIIALKMLI